MNVVRQSAGWQMVLAICAASVALRAMQTAAQRPTLTNPERTTAAAALIVSNSKCPVAADSTFGFTASNPIRVGGGVARGPARVTTYLTALRGRSGEAVQGRQVGVVPDPLDSRIMLRQYEVTRAGAARPLPLYFDEQRWTEPMAPSEMVCGTAVNLRRPGFDTAERTRQSLLISAEWGLRNIPPIPLDADGTTTHGMIFDHARIVGLAARAAFASGRPFEPDTEPRDIISPHLVVVAYGTRCGNQIVAPESVSIDLGWQTADKRAEVRGDRIGTLLPGFNAPASAVAVSYGLTDPSLLWVAITYPACATPREVSLPIKHEPITLVQSAEAILPTRLQLGLPLHGFVPLQGFVDVDRTFRFPQHDAGCGGGDCVGGPSDEQIDTAIRSAADWRIEPARMNGAPVLQLQNIVVRLRAP